MPYKVRKLKVNSVKDSCELMGVYRNNENMGLRELTTGDEIPSGVEKELMMDTPFEQCTQAEFESEKYKYRQKKESQNTSPNHSDEYNDEKILETV